MKKNMNRTDLKLMILNDLFQPAGRIHGFHFNFQNNPVRMTSPKQRTFWKELLARGILDSMIKGDTDRIIKLVKISLTLINNQNGWPEIHFMDMEKELLGIFLAVGMFGTI